MATLASLVVELAANTAKFQQGMQQAVGTAQKSASQIQSSLSNIQSSFTGAIAMVQRFAGALGLVVGVGGLVAAGRAAMNFADEIDEMSERLGIGAERLQELRFAAGQSGVSAEKLELGIRNLGNTIADAARGEQAAVKTFREMGVSIEGVAGMTAPLETVMGRVADRINSAVSPTEKLGIASKAFGERVGSFLIPILGRGQKGIEEWAKAARDAGVVMSTEMIQQAAKAKDMLDAMATAIMANLVPAIVAISPLLIKMAQSLSDIAAAAGRAMGSFAPFAAMTTEDLRSQLAKVDADLAKRREFLQKLREENEERSKGLITQFLPKSPGAIPHEIQRLQLEKEAIEKLLAERAGKGAEVKGMVIGTGKPDPQLEAFRQQLVDLATTDPVAQALLKVRQQVVKLTEALPESAAAIAAIGKAMEDVIVRSAGMQIEDTAIKALAESLKEDVKEFEGFEAAMFPTGLEQRIAQTRGEILAEADAIEQLRVSLLPTIEAGESFEATTANLSDTVKSTPQPIIEMEKALTDLAEQQAVFGDSFTSGAKKIDIFRAAMEGLRGQGEAFSDEMAAVKRQLDEALVGTEIERLDESIRGITNQAQVMGNSFDIVGARAEAVRQALIRLMGLPQTTETQAAIANLTAELDKLNAVAMAQTGIRDIFGALNQAVNQSIAGVIQGTLTLEEAFKNMGQSIALSLIQNIINRGINVVMEAVIAMVAKLAAAGLVGATAQAGAAPIMVGAGTGIPGGAEGAYVKHTPGGSLMRVGEGGKDEAIFPLERVPVNPGQGGGDTKIIINNNAGAQVGASEKQTPDGRQIEVMIDRVVTDGFSSGRYGGVLSSTYGLNRKGRVS